MPSTHRRAGMGAKYHNRKAERDGFTFDSQAEAARYLQLKAQQEAGDIDSLTVHPAVELQPGFSHKGKRYRAIRYEGDFRYREEGREVWEEVKGFTQNRVWLLKEKLFRARYPDIDLRIIKV